MFETVFMILMCGYGVGLISRIYVQLEDIQKKLGIEPRPKKKLFDFRKKGDK